MTTSTTPTVPESIRGEQNGYLETIGRVSGEPRVTEIWFAAEDDRIYLLSGYHNAKDWIRNLTKTPRVRFRIGDRWFTGLARIVDADSNREEGDRIRHALAGKYYNGDLAGGDNWATTGTPFAIDLDRHSRDESSDAAPGLDNSVRTGFIETTGRRSSEPRETQIGFAADGERIYVIASKGAGNDWVKNLVRNAGVRFRIGETWHVGQARIAQSEPDIATVRREMMAKYTGSKIGTDWIGTGLPIVIDVRI